MVPATSARIVCGALLLLQQSCTGFTHIPAPIAGSAFSVSSMSSSHESPTSNSRYPRYRSYARHRKCSVESSSLHHPYSTARRRRPRTSSTTITAALTMMSSRHSKTPLFAKGFGTPPRPPPRRPPSSSQQQSTPNPSAYYPNNDEDDRDDEIDRYHEAEKSNSNGEGARPLPDFGADARKVTEPRGIGTLFEREDEVIRELSSEEYTDILRDWAPLASFAANEAKDPDIRNEGAAIRTVLRGMAEWQPKRNSDFTKKGSKWAFGAPIGAIKGGQVDAMACLQVSERDGIVIEWICGNPTTLGIPGNAVDWLSRGVYALCGKRLDLPVTISGGARGEWGDAMDDDEDDSKSGSSSFYDSGEKKGGSRRKGGGGGGGSNRSGGSGNKKKGGTGSSKRRR